jgi:hypothetical protein
VVPTLNLFNGSLFDTVIDLTFTSTSRTTADNGQEIAPELGSVTAFHQTMRQAIAVGSVAGNGGEFVTAPSVDAQITSTRVSTTVIP